MLGGKWFWNEGWHKEDDEKAKLVLFRAAFEGRPDNTHIRITADTRYKLYVNGVHIQSGPSKGDDKVRYIDEADIGEWLTEGENVIAVNVLRYSFDHPYHSNHSLFASQTPGLYIEGIDLKWKSHIVRTVRFEGEEGGFAPLHVHERIATDPAAKGWKKAGFDDSRWDDAVQYAADELPDILKPENLADRTIPYMRRSKVCFRSATDDVWEALIRGNGQVTIPENSDLSVTLYQLYADKKAGRLEGVTDYLMIPEYLLYKLCGAKAHEYTNATTGGMVNAKTGEFDKDIIEAAGLPEHLFGELTQPGAVIGEYKGIKCVLCATHDTASAVEGIPMDEDQPYISSGTWSLLGVKSPEAITNAGSELANWSNEGGVGYVRYQKNIMGMWLVNRLRDCLCPGKDFGEIVAEAEASRFEETVDANAKEFLAPDNMKEAFDEALSIKPQSVGDYFRCAYRSLALSYMNAVQELQHNTGNHYEKIYIVGGGAKNKFLNELTEKASGKKVIALPIEATALGNLKMQYEADKN